jgi:hypothetical protein
MPHSDPDTPLPPPEPVEPEYNPITSGEIDLSHVLDAYDIPYPDIEPLYNPATQAMIDADDVDDDT